MGFLDRLRREPDPPPRCRWCNNTTDLDDPISARARVCRRCRVCATCNAVVDPSASPKWATHFQLCDACQAERDARHAAIERDVAISRAWWFHTLTNPLDPTAAPSCRRCGGPDPKYEPGRPAVGPPDEYGVLRAADGLLVLDGLCDGCRWTQLQEERGVIPRRSVYWSWFVTLTGPLDGPPFTLGAADDGAAIVLTPSVRNRHLYIIGKTGSGKSSLLRNLIMQDLDAGRGVIFLDPHGDTAQQLLGYVPDHRRDDVTYFCPTDPQAPAFNLLASPYPADKLTRDMVSAIKMFFGDSWGPRLNQLLTNALATLLLDRGHEAHTLADLETLLLDAGYRADVVARCRQPRLQAFWQAQFPTMSKDAVNPVLNKLADLLMPTSPLERIFSTRTNSLDLTATMDGGRILLCNLSKGELGDAAAFLLGGLIVTAVAQAALARATQPEDQRRDVFLYVDEFQNFAIDSFQTILSEARKYRLNLTLAHQYLHQVPADLQAAIFGNVAVVAAFATSAADGAIMRREMAHVVTTTTGDNAEAIAAAEERNRRARERARERAQRDYFDSGTSALDRHNLDLDRRAEDLASDHLKPVPDYAEATTEELWPDARDFLALQPLHGFVKIGTVDTTQRFSIAHPIDPPRGDVAAAIIAHQRAQHVAPQPQPDVPADTSPLPPPKDDPDDFTF